MLFMGLAKVLVSNVPNSLMKSLIRLGTGNFFFSKSFRAYNLCVVFLGLSVARLDRFIRMDLSK